MFGYPKQQTDCSIKKKYATKGAAQVAAFGIYVRYRDKQDPYFCPQHECWHLGHK